MSFEKLSTREMTASQKRAASTMCTQDGSSRSYSSNICTLDRQALETSSHGDNWTSLRQWTQPVRGLLIRVLIASLEGRRPTPELRCCITIFHYAGTMIFSIKNPEMQDCDTYSASADTSPLKQVISDLLGFKAWHETYGVYLVLKR